jgi:hypothetical protein
VLVNGGVFSGDCTGGLDDEHLVYRLRKPTIDGHTELVLTPLSCSTGWRGW